MSGYPPSQPGMMPPGPPGIRPPGGAGQFGPPGGLPGMPRPPGGFMPPPGGAPAGGMMAPPPGLPSVASGGMMPPPPGSGFMPPPPGGARPLAPGMPPPPVSAPGGMQPPAAAARGPGMGPPPPLPGMNGVGSMPRPPAMGMMPPPAGMPGMPPPPQPDGRLGPPPPGGAAGGFSPQQPGGGGMMAPPPPPGPNMMMGGPPRPGMMSMPPPPPGAGGNMMMGGMAPPGPPGMMPPPPPGVGMGGPPAPPGMGAMGGGYDPYAAQRMMEQFESLAIGSGPGEQVDLGALPRPAGDAAEPAYTPAPQYDQYSCSPDNMRMTVNAIPSTAALKARWQLPLGAVVQPMADEYHGRQVPVVDLGSAGIIRCRRCRTYMNPFMQWTDGGRRFKCNVCALANEVPNDYYCPLDHDGRRRDWDQRPELCCGTVEYIAPQEYMVRPPQPPTYLFVIDVSYAAVSSGMVSVAANTIKSCLDSLPGDVRTRVGIMTFDSTLHFYSLKPGLSQPQMMVVAELDDPFLPLPDDLLVTLTDSRSVIESLLDSLPNTFASTNIPDSAMGPALQAAYLVMQHIGGKLLLFQAAVPNLGPGKIKARDQGAASAWGTDREATLRQPEDAFYKRFAAEASRVQITVDIFAFSIREMDLASLAAIPRFTCGELYHYPGFVGARDNAKLTAELTYNLSRPTAWEAVMRIRCSKGLRCSSFHGHFFNRSTDLLALPTCDPSKAFAVQIALEENVVSGSIAYVQCALLYTNSNGERRIRVHTLCVPVVTELSELYRAADGAASAALLAKLAVEDSLRKRLDETRTAIQNKVAGALKEFRLMHSGAPAAAALLKPNCLVFPEQLRCVPVWALGAIKCAALRGSLKDVHADERIAVGHDIMSAPVRAACRILYPDMYPLHETGGDVRWGEPGPDGLITLPSTVPLSGAFLETRGAYLLDCGRVLVLWLGAQLDRDWAMQVFGMEVETADPSRLHVEPPREGSALSQRVNALLGALREGRPLHPQCFVVKQASPMETHVWQYFVEDRGQGTQTYPDWLNSLQKAVMAK